MSNKAATILEVNGQRYDVKTGALLGVSQKSPAPGNAANGSPSNSSPKPTAKPAIAPATASATSNVSSKKTMDIKRNPGRTATAHRPERATTLMRSVVKKPAAGSGTRLKSVTATDILAKTPSVTARQKPSIQTVDPSRAARARSTEKSGLIKKFAGDIIAPRRAAPPAEASVTPKPAGQPGTAQPAPARSAKRSMDIFQRALAKADSHLEPAYDPKKHAKELKKAQKAAHRHQHQTANRRWSLRIAAVISVLAIAVLVGGFALYQHRVDLALQYASKRLDFSIRAPGYEPAGFKFDKLTYNSTQAVITYSQPDTNSSFSLTEQKSTWSNQALIDNFVARSNKTYQTIKSSGRTFYVYGTNDVSWVYNNVWFRIHPSGSLSTTDVINIANSL